MEITIGIQNQSRELNLETEEPAETVVKRVKEAINAGQALELTDVKGRRLIIPTASLGYVEIGSEEQHPVGFGAIV